MARPKIGAHVSAAGGLYKAVENAKKIGADCFQIFGASPRQWHAKMPSSEDVEKFESALKDSKLGPAYLHAAYLVNLASPNKETLNKSVRNLTDHLTIASIIGAEGLIFHVGSSKGLPRKKALDQEVNAIKSVLKKVPGRSKLFMENSAGGGDKIGDIEDIGYLYKKVNSDRVKVCFDTAHAFEAGLIEKYNKASIKKLFDQWHQAVGIGNIEVIHTNDSKTPMGSHHDRHENIGKGYIGLEGFKSLAKEKRLHNKVWILEVP